MARRRRGSDIVRARDARRRRLRREVRDRFDALAALRAAGDTERAKEVQAEIKGLERRIRQLGEGTPSAALARDLAEHPPEGAT